MKTYKFQASTTSNKEILKAMSKSLALLKDSTHSLGDIETLHGVSVCTLSFTTEHSLEELKGLFASFTIAASEVGIELLILHTPDTIKLDQSLFVVLNGSDPKPLQSLIDCIPVINKVGSSMQLLPGDVQAITGGYILVVDVSYDSTMVTAEFVEKYFDDCCKAYGIQYNIYKGAITC